MAVNIRCALAWEDVPLLQRIVREFNREQQGQIQVNLQTLPLSQFLDRLRQIFRDPSRPPYTWSESTSSRSPN
jgi:hypothetical protein